MSDVPQVKVGDKLIFRRRGFNGLIYEVTKIMPSGRIQCGPYTLNTDLTVRGGKGYRPYKGAFPTAEELVTHQRLELLSLITPARIAKLSNESIQKIVDIIIGEA